MREMNTMVHFYFFQSPVHGETEEEEEQDLGIADTYAVLYKIIFLPLMPMTIAFLLTSKIGFSAADSATGIIN